MRFGDAMLEARAGREVIRPGMAKKVYVTLGPGGVPVEMGMYGVESQRKSRAIPFVPSVEDVFAEDWRIA